MAAELESLMNVDTVRFGELSAVETPSALHRVADPAWFTNRMQTLSLVLESLWLFYEAMRAGKPLASGEERLTQMRAALKIPSTN